MNFQLWLSTLLTAFAATSARQHETIQGRSCFRSMRGMMDSMFYLAEDHPDLVTITDIGDSYLKNNEGRHFGRYEIPDGGYDIYAINVTASDGTRLSADKGKMLVTSGVHAREWAPPELLARFLELLVHGYNDNAEIRTVLQTTEVHAILYVNPDGRFMAEKYPELYWRKNMRPIHCGGGTDYGVDINRNFNFMWGDQAGASNHPCASDYHGPSAESEPETRAMVEYAKKLFPESQRRSNPEEHLHEPFGEDITGMYIDIHSSGGYVYYPWGHKDAKSPDDDALQALGRKINYFNGYKLWAGSQPDFLYAASGDTSDWAYGALGVASLGFEIGDDFQQECDSFESDVVPKNLPALLFAAKNAHKPFSSIKGPDVFHLNVNHMNGYVRVSAHVSDGKMVNSIVDGRDFTDFKTGDQDITSVYLYLDVHPDDYQENADIRWTMDSADGSNSSDENVEVVLRENLLSPGRHTLFAQATDSDGYKGPVTSVFVDISGTVSTSRTSSLRGSRNT